jgi:hypothetical protein
VNLDEPRTATAFAALMLTSSTVLTISRDIIVVTAA